MMPVIASHRRFLLPAIAALAVIASSLASAYTLVGHTWGTSTVRYYVNPSSKWVSQSAAISAVQTAAAGWNDQTRANIELVYAGTTNGSSLVNNGKNEVFFRDTASHVAETYYWWDGSGRFVDGDIVMNEGGYQFFAGSGCVNGIYIENVVIHEFGHVLGLLHSDVAGATMQPAMQSYCDRTQLTLEADDIAGIEKLYPPSGGGGPAQNSAPVLSIASPATNLSFNEGTLIPFSASASDSQDGSLTGAITWRSNLSGVIGSGGSFSRTLSVGVHTITAAVTDSGGLSSAQQIVATVISIPSSPLPGSPTLSANGYKVKGVQRADLRWSGISATSVDVYRDGAKVSTVPNSSSATDNINKKGAGSYSYKVCASGSATCTNTASVNF